MGLSDLFANATNALVPPPVPPKSEVSPTSAVRLTSAAAWSVPQALTRLVLQADLDRSKDEIVRRLTEELVQTRQVSGSAEFRQMWRCGRATVSGDGQARYEALARAES